jgi:hypothetical protein
MVAPHEYQRVDELMTRAVEEAIRLGIEPSWMMANLRTAWQFELEEKKRRDDREFAAAGSLK